MAESLHVVCADGAEFDVAVDDRDQVSIEGFDGVVTAPFGLPVPGEQWLVFVDDALGRRHHWRSARILRVNDWHAPEGPSVRPEFPVMWGDTAAMPKEVAEHEMGVKEPRDEEPAVEPAPEVAPEDETTPATLPEHFEPEVPEVEDEADNEPHIETERLAPVRRSPVKRS